MVHPTPATVPLDKIRDRYRAFAEREARGVSPLYEELANRVADSEALQRFISSFPPAKQQPNLLFAAVRHLCGTPRDSDEFGYRIETHAESLRALILSRRTQTNEPGRCATLLPVLASLPEPLALIEVGASAGLCLLPDCYGYDYGRVRILPEPIPGMETPIFPCRANDATPLPQRAPQVAWRAGLDLNPLDLSDPEEVKWLESLVWPGQEGRVERLRGAIRVARHFPLPVRLGNLLTDLPALAATAPTGATLVVFHSAVLSYVQPTDRKTFVDVVRGLNAVWISNEAPGVLPEIDRRSAVEVPANRFILSVDGNPVAFTGPHGQALDWIDGVPT